MSTPTPSPTSVPSTPQPVRGQVSATVDTLCTGPGTATVTVGLALSGGSEAVSYTVRMSQQQNVDGVLTPNSPNAKVSFAGVANGTYNVSVNADGGAVFNQMVTVSCQGA